MLGIVKAIGFFATAIALWVLRQWGLKVALVAVVVAAYATVFSALVLLVTSLLSLIPASPFPDFLLQFFPSPWAIAAAGSAYWGTAAVVSGYTWWRLSLGVAAKIGS